MTTSRPGVAFSETMSGWFALGETDPRIGAIRGQDAGTKLAMHATIAVTDIQAFVDDPLHNSGLSGSVDFAPLGIGLPAPSGVFRLFSPGNEPGLKWMVYELAFTHAGQPYYLAGKKHVRRSLLTNLWKETTTLYTQLHQGHDSSGPVIGAGVLSLDIGELLKLVSSFHATNAPRFTDRLNAVGAFAGFFARELWNSYVVRR